MLRPRRRLVLEGEGETVEVSPGGVGDTGCENISNVPLQLRDWGFRFRAISALGGVPSVEVGAVIEGLRHWPGVSRGEERGGRWSSKRAMGPSTKRAGDLKNSEACKPEPEQRNRNCLLLYFLSAEGKSVVQAGWYYNGTSRKVPRRLQVDYRY